jgi:hypothetical protein
MCNAGGIWTGHTPQCQPIACGDPVTFAHASVALLNGSTVWKAVAQYACIHGYKEANSVLNIGELDDKSHGIFRGMRRVQQYIDKSALIGDGKISIKYVH